MTGCRGREKGFAHASLDGDLGDAAHCVMGRWVCRVGPTSGESRSCPLRAGWGRVPALRRLWPPVISQSPETCVTSLRMRAGCPLGPVPVWRRRGWAESTPTAMGGDRAHYTGSVAGHSVARCAPFLGIQQDLGIRAERDHWACAGGPAWGLAPRYHLAPVAWVRSQRFPRAKDWWKESYGGAKQDDHGSRCHQKMG